MSDLKRCPKCDAWMSFKGICFACFWVEAMPTRRKGYIPKTNMGDYPELTQQLIDAEKEARDELASK